MKQISLLYRIANNLCGCVYLLREKYHQYKSYKLKNKTPTIISNDCTATFIYHDMGLPFNSPTINLYINKNDFIKFLNDLSGFLESDVYEVKDSKVNYPVGEIHSNGEHVRIYFMHYESFKNARKKWNERKRRIDFSNTYIIQMLPYIIKEDIEVFDKLPYENKMLITNKNLTNSKNVVEFAWFDKKGFRPAKILEFKSKFSLKRYLDDIDCISFLNRGH